MARTRRTRNDAEKESKVKEEVKEDEENDHDEQEEEEEHKMEETPKAKKSKAMSEYERQRLENIQRNVEMMAMLDMHSSADALIPKPKKSPSIRGLQKSKRKKKEPIERRQSKRIRGEDVEGNQVIPKQLTTKQSRDSHRRSEARNEDPISFYVISDDEDDNSDNEEGDGESKRSNARKAEMQTFSKSLRALASPKNLKPKEVSSGTFMKTLSAMTMGDNSVAKVVKERIFGIAVHPSPDKVIVAAGDKWGQLGLFDVNNPDEEKCVTLFTPHRRPITKIIFDPSDLNKVYTSSYEGIIRCMDFNSDQFAVTAQFDPDSVLQSFDYNMDKGVMAAAFDTGEVSIFDPRAKPVDYQFYDLHDKKVRHLHFNPVHTDILATSSLDCYVNIWDLRKLGGKSSQKSALLGSLQHGRGVTSSFFSPISGNQLLTTSWDNTIRVWKKSNWTTSSKVEDVKLMRHNNQTNRWLTPFQAVWEPKNEEIFYVGSMEKIRGIDVYSSKTSSKVRRLENEDHMTSITSLIAVHPSLSVVAGGNSSGRVFTFQSSK